ncbi:MAG: cation transporter [Planctomycetaceae bacterium]|nr:cation transporter [Planctomycetaceae bacterium]
MSVIPLSRHDLLRRGLAVEAALIGWNVIEGVVAIAAGLLASSVALIGFGIDSGIEVVSAAVVTWRLWIEFRWASSDRVEVVERRAARVAGSILLLLAVYIVIDGGRRLLGSGPKAETSLVGIVLTAVSLVVMPILGWVKLGVAQRLGSGALRADSVQTFACVWLSVSTLIGLTANAAFGWSWADPLSAVVIVPLVVREGVAGLRGRSCCAH